MPTKSKSIGIGVGFQNSPLPLNMNWVVKNVDPYAVSLVYTVVVNGTTLGTITQPIPQPRFDAYFGAVYIGWSVNYLPPVLPILAPFTTPVPITDGDVVSLTVAQNVSWVPGVVVLGASITETVTVRLTGTIAKFGPALVLVPTVVFPVDPVNGPYTALTVQAVIENGGPVDPVTTRIDFVCTTNTAPPADSGLCHIPTNSTLIFWKTPAGPGDETFPNAAGTGFVAGDNLSVYAYYGRPVGYTSGGTTSVGPGGTTVNAPGTIIYQTGVSRGAYQNYPPPAVLNNITWPATPVPATPTLNGYFYQPGGGANPQNVVVVVSGLDKAVSALKYTLTINGVAVATAVVVPIPLGNFAGLTGRYALYWSGVYPNNQTILATDAVSIVVQQGINWAPGAPTYSLTATTSFTVTNQPPTAAPSVTQAATWKFWFDSAQGPQAGLAVLATFNADTAAMVTNCICYDNNNELYVMQPFYLKGDTLLVWKTPPTDPTAFGRTWNNTDVVKTIIKTGYADGAGSYAYSATTTTTTTVSYPSTPTAGVLSLTGFTTLA